MGLSMLTFPSLPLGTVKGACDIDSIPPTIIISDSPERIEVAANIIAFILEPHILFIVSAGILSGMPAFKAAWRAGCCPMPADRTLPIMTSSTVSGSILVCSNVALIANAPKSTAEVSKRAPLNFPWAVLTPPTITTSLAYSIGFSSDIA